MNEPIVKRAVVIVFAMAAIIVASLVCADRASANPFVPRCLSQNATPGVVTPNEVSQVRSHETRHDVRCLFGTTGQKDGHGYWGSDYRWHIVRTYVTSDGGVLYGYFIDDHSDGHVINWRYARWYGPDGSETIIQPTK